MTVYARTYAMNKIQINMLCWKNACALGSNGAKIGIVTKNQFWQLYLLTTILVEYYTCWWLHLLTITLVDDSWRLLTITHLLLICSYFQEAQQQWRKIEGEICPRRGECVTHDTVNDVITFMIYNEGMRISYQSMKIFVSSACIRMWTL